MRLALLTPLLLAGCGDVAYEPTEAAAPSWPKRVTITTTLSTGEARGVRLFDGALIENGGDLTLVQAMVLSLRSPSMESICEKGTFDALQDVPVEETSCPAAPSLAWQDFSYLSAASLHTTEESYAAGAGLLVRNEEHSALYRLLVVGDSYDMEGVSTATFDYEPIE